MPRSGTGTFIDPDEYQEGLRQAQIDLLVAGNAAFEGRVTWSTLHHLRLLRSEEDLPRIGYLSLPPALVFVGFAARGSADPLGRRGVAIDRDHIHSRGARFHLRTTGPSSWSLIGLSQEDLGRFGGPLDAALTKGQERRGIELERTDVLMGGQQLLNQLIAISSPTLPALVARPASAPRCASSNSSPPTSATRIHDRAYARAAEEVLDWCARVGTNTPMRNWRARP
jgi:hypothetical protein